MNIRRNDNGSKDATKATFSIDLTFEEYVMLFGFTGKMLCKEVGIPQLLMQVALASDHAAEELGDVKHPILKLLILMSEDLKQQIIVENKEYLP